MDIALRIMNIALGGIFTLIVIYLLIKKKMTEKSSLLWLIGSAVILILSIAPGIVDKIAKLIGVFYPPGLIFLLAIVLLLLLSLVHTVQINTLNKQIRELTQYMVVKDSFNKRDEGSTLE